MVCVCVCACVYRQGSRILKTTPKRVRGFNQPERVETLREETSTPLTMECLCTVMCKCIHCCQNINLSPINLGRLIRACRDGANEPKSSSKFICNLSDFTLDKNTICLLSKGLTFIPKPRMEKKHILRQEVDDFIRKLRLKYEFRNKDQLVPELYRRTGYNPGKTGNPTLERL